MWLEALHLCRLSSFYWRGGGMKGGSFSPTFPQIINFCSYNVKTKFGTIVMIACMNEYDG